MSVKIVKRIYNNLMISKNYTPIDDFIKKYQQTKYVSKPKEAEPAPSVPKEHEIKEVIEHEPKKELQAYLQPRAETIKLPPDLKKLGLQPTTTTQFPSYQNIKLPISDDKIVFGLHAPVSSSLRWLATLAIYLLKKAHLTLKIVHGKVVRILKT